MGQAQLLLIVLGVVLVGIAIIAGINAYDTNNRKASVDALTHDAVRIASDMQVWVQKPLQFGGPTTYAGFSEVTDLTVIGYELDPVVNSNGSCTQTATGTDITGGNTVVCSNDGLGTSVTATINGIADEDIVISAQVLGY